MRRLRTVLLISSLLLVAGLALLRISKYWDACCFGSTQQRPDSHAHSQGFPKTLPLPDNKSIIIPTYPIRIVAANTGAADILAELIDIKRFAAVPVQVEEYAADPDFWKRNPSIPRFEKFHAERILGYRPDLVISSAFQDSTAAAAIEQQHVPILHLNDFESLDGVRSAITIVGDAVGCSDAAKRMLATFDSDLKKVADSLAGKKPVTVIIYSNYGSGYTAGSGVCQDDMIQRAGGVNLAAQNGIKGHASLTFEQLLRMDPDFILVGGEAGLNSPQVKLLMSEPILKELRAVKNRHIVVVPSRYIYALSQYSVRAVEEIARQLHPEIKP